MTKQETFDIVAKHLLAQNKKALAVFEDNINEGCAYRGADGTKCAAGCLIPDDKYDPTFEGVGVVMEDYAPPPWTQADDTAARALRLQAILLAEGHNLGLVQNLQKIHDHCHPQDWKTALLGSSKLYGLNAEVLNAF